MTSTVAVDEVSEVTKEWSTALMKKLFRERPRFCDIAIKCIDEETLYAHRAVLASRTQYFLQAFLGPSGGSGGATLSVQTATVPMSGGSSHGVDARSVSSISANFDPDASTVGMLPPLRRSGSNFFKESAVMLEKIFEFLYLGEIAKLEDMGGVVDERDYNIWMFLLTWSFKHKVHDLFQYILGHLLRVQLAPELASRLLDLHIESSFSMTETLRVTGSLDGSQSNVPLLLERLRMHAISCFNRADFSKETFLPLNRAALEMVLTECIFAAPELQVIQAVTHWTEASPWVKSAYGGAAMQAEQVASLLDYTDPRCLTAAEFAEFDMLYSESTVEYVYQAHCSDPEVIARERIAERDVCTNRKELLRLFAPQEVTEAITEAASAAPEAIPEAAAPPAPPAVRHGSATSAPGGKLTTFTAQSSSTLGDRRASNNAAQAPFAHVHRNSMPSMGPPDAPPPYARAGRMDPMGRQSSMPVPAPRPQAAAPPRAPGEQRRPTGSSPKPRQRLANRSTGVAAPVMTITPKSTPEQTLAEIDMQARIDPTRAETSFVKGRNLFLKREDAPYRSLLSLESSTYQGMMYRGSIARGIMRWQLTVVRPCDMFWMGVTSRFSLDMSTMIANDRQVWMISEEATCFEHCRANAVTQGTSVKQRINLLFIDCFKCADVTPDPWATVEMELNTVTGVLSAKINDFPTTRIFENLPTNKPLYPCLMAVNTGQAHFQVKHAQILD